METGRQPTHTPGGVRLSRRGNSNVCSGSLACSETPPCCILRTQQVVRWCSASVLVRINTTNFIIIPQTTRSRFVRWLVPIVSTKVRRVVAVISGVRPRPRFLLCNVTFAFHQHRSVSSSSSSSSRPASTPLLHFIFCVVDLWHLEFVFGINIIVLVCWCPFVSPNVVGFLVATLLPTRSVSRV